MISDVDAKKKLYYIDTNLFIDVIENRKNLFGKDISTPACTMFFNSVKCNFNMAISSWTLKELYKKIDENQVKMFFELAKKKIKIVYYDGEDKKKAKDISFENFHDALHIVLAKKIGADLIITRDVDHFEELGSPIEPKKPEWIN